MKYIALEHHPNDSRLRVINEDVCQTLSSRMGTGGGNVPIVLIVNDQGGVASVGVEKKLLPLSEQNHINIFQ